MAESFSLSEWTQYYSRKRIVHQWTQVHLLSTVPCRRVLEIGPAMGLVTALLVWEEGLRDSGRTIVRREFTEHTRSVHLLEAA